MAQCLPFAGTAKAIFSRAGKCTMSEPALLRLKRFEMAQKAQKVSLLETMVRDFENLALISPNRLQMRRSAPNQVSSTCCLLDLRHSGGTTPQQSTGFDGGLEIEARRNLNSTKRRLSCVISNWHIPKHRKQSTSRHRGNWRLMLQWSRSMTYSHALPNRPPRRQPEKAPNPPHINSPDTRRRPQCASQCPSKSASDHPRSFFRAHFFQNACAVVVCKEASMGAPFPAHHHPRLPPCPPLPRIGRRTPASSPRAARTAAATT